MRLRFRVYEIFFFGTAMRSKPSRSKSDREDAASEAGAAPWTGAAAVASCGSAECGGDQAAPSRCHTAHGPSTAADATRLRSSHDEGRCKTLAASHLMATKKDSHTRTVTSGENALFHFLSPRG